MEYSSIEISPKLEYIVTEDLRLLLCIIHAIPFWGNYDLNSLHPFCYQNVFFRNVYICYKQIIYKNHDIYS